MDIVYLSSVCSKKRFERLVNSGKVKSQFQNQKFHHLLLTGLVETGNHNIQVISFCPQVRTSKVFFHQEQEEENGIRYVYPSYIDRPFINPISRFFTTLKCIRKKIVKDSVVVCNIMNFEECMAALFYRLFHKQIKICAIVADVPGLTSGANNVKTSKWKKTLSRMVLSMLVKANKRYDGYLFLTEAMNDVVNKKNKPYVVVEGLTDLKMSEVHNDIEQKYKTPTILYAGGLHREYGIEWLVDAFQKIDNSNVELHIYGYGNFEKELIERARIDSRIKYWGTKSNKEIVEEQIKASLLVNPRPTDAEFVKYSFPSKVMECMVSGTPLLTTCLPGMPKDYYPYVYLIKEETIDCLQKTISKLLQLPPEELHQKGNKAKRFVLENKNNKKQAEKLFTLLANI